MDFSHEQGTQIGVLVIIVCRWKPWKKVYVVKEDVPACMFEEEKLFTISEHFATGCLHQEVLRATLCGLNHLRGDIINFENRSMRYAAYLIYTWWVHNRLGRGVRKVITSSVIWKI